MEEDKEHTMKQLPNQYRNRHHHLIKHTSRTK